VLEHRLLVLRIVVLRVLGDIAELTGDADALGDMPAALDTERLELVLERLVALGGENDVPQGSLLNLRLRRGWPRRNAPRGRAS
jgi:hypothetical protein